MEGRRWESCKSALEMNSLELRSWTIGSYSTISWSLAGKLALSLARELASWEALSLAWEAFESRLRSDWVSRESSPEKRYIRGHQLQLSLYLDDSHLSCVSQIHTYCTSHLTSYISTSHILHFHALHRTSLHLTSYNQLFTWMTPTSPKVPNPHIYLHLSIIQGTYISPLFSAQFSIFPPPWPGVDIFCTWLVPGNVPLSFHPSFQSKHVNQSLNQLINHY